MLSLCSSTPLFCVVGKSSRYLRTILLLTSYNLSFLQLISILTLGFFLQGYTNKKKSLTAQRAFREAEEHMKVTNIMRKRAEDGKFDEDKEGPGPAKKRNLEHKNWSAEETTRNVYEVNITKFVNVYVIPQSRVKSQTYMLLAKPIKYLCFTVLLWSYHSLIFLCHTSLCQRWV